MYNSIERMYRTSINDRISELKDIISGTSAKVVKYIIYQFIPHFIY